MDPKKLTAQTTAYYDINVSDFWEGTKDHDVSQNYHALLSAIEAPSPFKLLDFGCGPGRDLIYFARLGHEVTGLDGSPEFCRAAAEKSHCPVWHQDFIELKLPPQHFDGVFANASLFHIPRSELPRVLGQLSTCLRPRGVLFCSNPRGNGESFEEPRYANFMEIEDYRQFLAAAGFTIENHYYRPAGRPLAEQPWLAIVARKN
jgi:SAM-dependent methyltransferase